MYAVRIALGVAGCALLGAGTALAFQGEAAAAGVIYGATIVCLLFAFLPHIHKLKAFGIEAELKAKIAEADELLARLRGVMVPTADMLFSTNARMGRWSTGMPKDRKLDLMQRIDTELLQCGVTPAQLERAKADWHFFNVFDLCGPVDQKISDVLHAKLKEHQAAVDAVPQPIQPEMHERHAALIAGVRTVHAAIKELKRMRQQAADPALATRIRTLVMDSSLLDKREKAELLQSIKDELDDVQFYIEHKQFRRLSVWLNSRD